VFLIAGFAALEVFDALFDFVVFEVVAEEPAAEGAEEEAGEVALPAYTLLPGQDPGRQTTVVKENDEGDDDGAKIPPEDAAERQKAGQGVDQPAGSDVDFGRE